MRSRRVASTRASRARSTSRRCAMSSSVAARRSSSGPARSDPTRARRSPRRSASTDRVTRSTADAELRAAAAAAARPAAPADVKTIAIALASCWETNIERLSPRRFASATRVPTAATATKRCRRDVRRSTLPASIAAAIVTTTAGPSSAARCANSLACIPNAAATAREPAAPSRTSATTIPAARNRLTVRTGIRRPTPSRDGSGPRGRPRSSRGVGGRGR
jgi:hypothetical protein